MKKWRDLRPLGLLGIQYPVLLLYQQLRLKILQNLMKAVFNFFFLQRADGSMRKTRRVKEGYVPPEDIGKFVCSAERAYRQKAHYVVGTSQARDPNARGSKLIMLDFFFLFFLFSKI